MKIKLLLGIGIVAIGVGAYVYFSLKNMDNPSIRSNNANGNGSNSDGQKTDSQKITIISGVEKHISELRETKADSVSEITERHVEAASVMKDSLNQIYSEDEVKDTENTETINQMMSDLDDLIE